MMKTLGAALLAMGYVLASGTPLLVMGTVPFALIGCERDSDVENAAEDVGDKIEDAGDEVEDKLD
jgi:hypothetical protein